MKGENKDNPLHKRLTSIDFATNSFLEHIQKISEDTLWDFLMDKGVSCMDPNQKRFVRNYRKNGNIETVSIYDTITFEETPLYQINYQTLTVKKFIQGEQS